VFAGVNNSWCSEEEETSSPPEDGLTDGRTGFRGLWNVLGK
jgi:hypothetical protein